MGNICCDEALLEVARQETLPEVKQQEALPEIKQQEALPEVKQQEAPPITKEPTVIFKRLESKFHFEEKGSENSPRIDVGEGSPKANPLTDTDGSKFRDVEIQTIPLQKIPKKDPRLIAGVKVDVCFRNVKSNWVLLMLSYDFRYILMERDNLLRLIPLKYILYISSTEEELKEQLSQKLISDVGDVNLRVAVSIIGLAFPVCLDFESIAVKQSLIQAVEMLSMLDYGKTCANVSYLERGKKPNTPVESRTPKSGIKESNKEDGKDSLEEVFEIGRLESKVELAVPSDDVLKVDSAVQTLVIIPDIESHPDLLLGVPVIIEFFGAKKANASLRVDYEFKTLMISKNSSIRVLPCKFIIRIIEGQKQLTVEVKCKRISEVGDHQKRLAVSVVGLRNPFCIDFMDEHMKSRFSSDIKRLCDVAVVDQAAMIMDDRGVQGLVDITAETENE